MDQDVYELKILLPRQEVEALQQLADRFDQTPEDLIAGFVADLTNSDRTNGEEEHKAARSWWETIARNWS